MTKSLLITSIIFPALFFATPVNSANVGDIVVTEIMYNLEGADDPHEWVEVFNISNQSIDLTDWRFNDGKNHILNAPPEKGGQGSITIQPGEYIILADDASTFLSDHAGFSGTVIDTVMSLKNTSAALSLIDPDKNTIDSVTYQNSWGADGDGKSLEKINVSGNNDSSNWQESLLLGGTPGELNSVPSQQPEQTPPDPPTNNTTPQTAPPPSNPPPPDTTNTTTTINEPQQDEPSPDTTVKVSATSTQETATTTETAAYQEPPQVRVIVYPSNIFINELMPSPTGPDDQEEWIEIFNKNDEQVALSSWIIQDVSGKKTAYAFPMLFPKEQS